MSTERSSPDRALASLGASLALVLGGLALTNPSRQDYLDWVKDEEAKSTARRGADPIAVAAQIETALPAMDAATTRDDRIIFSVFRSGPIPGSEGRYVVAVGIAKHFFRQR